MIGNAINSVLLQTYEPIEIIVIDDGSNDNTRRIVGGFGDKVKYLYKKNGGVSSARNLGITKASGKYLAFLDSDDCWLPDKINVQMDVFQREPSVEMVICDYLCINREWEFISRIRRRDALPRNGMILLDVLKAPSLVPSTSMVLRDTMIELGMYDESLSTAEDLDFFIRFARQHRIYLIERPLVIYMRGHKGLSQVQSSDDDMVSVMERQLKISSQEIKEIDMKSYLFETYRKASMGKIWFGAYKESLKYMQKMLKQANTVKHAAEIIRQLLYLTIRYIKSKIYQNQE